MPKFHVATLDTPTAEGDELPPPSLLVDKSLTTLKDRLKADHPDTEWKIQTYSIGNDVETVLKLIEGAREFLATQKPEAQMTVRVKDGRIQKL